MEPADLDPILGDDDALSLWVGRVARTHALLEYDVENVRRLLSRRVGHAPGSNSLKGFDQLVSDCRKLLQGSDTDPEVLTSGDAALLAAKQATGIRNRVVHDMWLPDPLRDEWEPPRWNAFRRSGDLMQSYTSATSHNLAMVVETHTLLRRTRVRVSGLFMALHATWPSDQNRDRGPAYMARYVALMTDHFTLHANGDFDVT